MKRAPIGMLAIAIVALPGAAFAQSLTVAAPAAPPAPEAAAPAPPRARPDFVFGLGFRGTILRSAGFDPYSTNDLLSQISVSLGLILFDLGKTEILLSAQWDGGTRSGTARGEESSLGVHRFSGVAEMRYHLHRRFFLGAKVAPSALLLRGSITDPSLDRPLTASRWTWGLETAGEAGVLLGGSKPGFRIWLTLDLGYTFAGESEMAYSPAPVESDPRTYGSVMLPALRPSGPTSRLAIQAAF